ncbi:MAG: hypothetical protein V5A34_10275, partial [Halapricum sp.]
PADTFPDQQAEVVVVDVQQARDQFPADAYAEFNFATIADGYGVSESDFEYLIGLSRSGYSDVTAITGNYDPTAIIDHLGVSDDNVETDHGYQIIAGETAIGESAIIIGSDYDMLVNVRNGETASLGTTDDWRDLLVAISDGALVSFQQGDALSEDGQSPLDGDVESSAIEIDSAGGSRARTTMHLMFDSETRAQEVLDNNRQAIIDGATEDNGGSLERIEREGKRIVIVIETETFDF